MYTEKSLTSMQIFADAFDLWEAHRFIDYVIYFIFSCVPIKVFVIEKIRVFNGILNIN